MTAPRRALIVAPSPSLAESLSEWLVGAGYSTVVVRTFALARAELEAGAPELVVTELKLGAFNGLHLAVRCASRQARTPVIVVGEADPPLQAEAERQHAVYLTVPLSQPVFLAAVRKIQEEYRPPRRSPRKRVPLIDALLNDVPARLVDVSYEGLRLETNQQPIPPFFVLRIPMFNVSCPAQRVWTQPSGESGTMCCGAALVPGSHMTAAAWRALVDAAPGWTLLAH